MNNIYTFIDNLRRNTRLKTSFTASVIVFMIAHAYSCFNSSFATDRFRWFGHYDLKEMTGASMGKWFGQYLGFLSWNSYLPWLNGLIAAVYIAFSAYIVCEVLDVKKSLSIWLISGLMCTDACIIMSVFFAPQGFLLALITACASVWFWNRTELKIGVRIAFGALFISFSLGTYGSYTTVAPTVVVLACMFMLIEGEPVMAVFKRGIEYICTFLTGTALYYVILRILLKVQNIEMIPYMGEDKLVKGTDIGEILYCFELAYKNTILRYIGDYRGKFRVMPQWMAIAMLILGAAMIVTLIYRNDKMIRDKRSYILLGLLIAVFPLSAGGIYILAFGTVHHLMTYTYVLLYVGFVKLCETGFALRQYTDRRRITTSLITAGMLLCTVFVIYKGILVANMSYSRLDNLNTISEGIAIRVLDRVESCEGFEGHEKVCFVGDVTDSVYFNKSRYSDGDWLDILDGIIAVDKDQTDVFLYYSHLISFIKEYTETDLDIDYLDTETAGYTDDEYDIIEDMPCFPADGSVRKLGDTVVVKFSEVDIR